MITKQVDYNGQDELINFFKGFLLMAKQSKQDRLLRLSKGRCPIHGISMSQIGLEFLTSPDGQNYIGRHIVDCPRKDCFVLAYEETPHADAVLLPQFHHLIN